VRGDRAFWGATLCGAAEALRRVGILGSARVSRAGETVPVSRTFLRRLFRRDAETNTRDACATPRN